MSLETLRSTTLRETPIPIGHSEFVSLPKFSQQNGIRLNTLRTYVTSVSIKGEKIPQLDRKALVYPRAELEQIVQQLLKKRQPLLPLVPVINPPDHKTIGSSSSLFELLNSCPPLTLEQEKKLSLTFELGKAASLKLPDPGLTAENKQRLEQEVINAWEARNQLIQGNLRLVLFVAKKYLGRGITLPDLFQEGTEGLIIAADKFDISRGNRFSTYAVWWIRQEISRLCLNYSKIIRLPVHAYEARGEILEARVNFRREHGVNPTVKNLADLLEFPEAKVSRLINAQDAVSLNRRVGEDETSELQDFIADPDSVLPTNPDNFSLKEILEQFLGDLSPREERILRLRFGFDGEGGKSLQEIGDKFGLSRERIRQIIDKALDRLRHPSKTRKLKGFIP